MQAACERLGVTEPVALDRDGALWEAYGLQAWPALAFVDPHGHLSALQVGEVGLDEMEAIVARQELRYERSRTIKHGPSPFGRPPAAAGPLSFPSELCVAGDRAFVSVNHGVIELKLEDDDRKARPVREFGSREEGFADGPAGQARFRLPRGLAHAGRTLVVADTGNHAIRKIDLKTGDVTTIAGTGEPGDEVTPGPATTGTTLRSPWDLALIGRTLFVAMAGAREIWRMDPPNGNLSLHAGSGVEGISDGPQHLARLSQPMGMVAREGVIYFTDAESSSVRRTPAERNEEVTTLVGWELFESGDKDGRGEFCLLQHAEDVAWHRNGLLVADTYNDKIKLVEPKTVACEEALGEAGSGEVLHQPSGLWADDERVFVADANAHRIVRVDPDTGVVSEIEIY